MTGDDYDLLLHCTIGHLLRVDRALPDFNEKWIAEHGSGREGAGNAAVIPAAGIMSVFRD